MIHLARILNVQSDITPTPGKQLPQPDGNQWGWLRVSYKGEPRWARPCYPMGQFSPPSDLWYKAFSEKWGVWVTTEVSTFAEENDQFLVYLGFAPLIDGVDSDVVYNFPESSLHFGERWDTIFDNSKTSPSMKVRYQGSVRDPNDDDPDSPDGHGAEILTVDMTPGAETTTFQQYSRGQQVGTHVIANKDGDLQIRTHKDIITEVHGAVTTNVDKKVTLTFSDELEAAVTKKVTLTLSDELIADITKKVTATLHDQLALTITKAVDATLNDRVDIAVGKALTIDADSLKADIVKTIAMSSGQTTTIKGGGGNPSAPGGQTVFDTASVTTTLGGSPGLKVEVAKTTVGVGGLHGMIFEMFQLWTEATLNAGALHFHNATAPGAPTTPPTNWSLVTAASAGALQAIKSTHLELPPG